MGLRQMFLHSTSTSRSRSTPTVVGTSTSTAPAGSDVQALLETLAALGHVEGTEEGAFMT